MAVSVWLGCHTVGIVWKHHVSVLDGKPFKSFHDGKESLGNIKSFFAKGSSTISGMNVLTGAPRMHNCDARAAFCNHSRLKRDIGLRTQCRVFFPVSYYFSESFSCFDCNGFGEKSLFSIYNNSGLVDFA